MKNKHKLPLALVQDLAKQHIKKEDIISYAYVDMNTSCQFVKSYLVLTTDYLVFAEGKVDEKNVFEFDNTTEEQDKYSEYTLTMYKNEDIDSLKTSLQLRTGLVYIVGKKDCLVTYFTIGRYADVLQVVTDFNGVKNVDGDHKKRDRDDRISDAPRHKGPRPKGPMTEDMKKGGLDIPPKGAKNRNVETKATAIRLFSYLKHHKLKLLVLFISYIAIALCNLAWPYLSGTVLYDQVLKRNSDILKTLNIQEDNFILALLIVVICMILAKMLVFVFTTINSLINIRMNQTIIKDLRNDIFESMGTLSLRYFQSSQTGTLMVRVLHDATRVSRLLVDEMPSILINSFTILSTIFIMLAINVKLTLLSFIPLPFIFYISVKMRPRMHVLFGKRHRAERRLTTAVNDSITGVRVVKVFGKEEEEINKFSSVNEGVKSTEREITVFSNEVNAVQGFINSLITLIIWAVGAYLILSDTGFEYGVLLTFVGYANQFVQPINDLTRILRQWVDSMNAAERLFEIIDAVPEIVDKDNAIDMDDVEGHIEIDNVTFGYEPNIPVLKDFSLKVKAGQMLGIVGRSGAGKTTLVNIISRLYEIEKGSIKIDGIDIRDISLKSLRKNIAMVSQETYIFMGTIAENIAYAKPDATREEIIRAATMASAHEFICKLPEGYDTVIGSAGRRLSGGERQRLSIARAILADPKILILDEATASVDTKTEQAIQASLAELAKNRTTLSIAHRLSTLKSADYLIVLEHGRIIEEGTHNELMEKNGTYCMLKELQTNALAMKGLE